MSGTIYIATPHCGSAVSDGLFRLFRALRHERTGSDRRGLTDLDWLTDSVVTYKSAHIGGAVSEKPIDSDHSVEEHIEAFL